MNRSVVDLFERLGKQRFDLDAAARAVVGADLDLGFKDWSAMPQVYAFWEILLKILGASVVAYALYKLGVWALRALLDRTKEIQAEELHTVLAMADKQRSKIDVTIGASRPIPCALAAVEKDALALELPEYVNLSHKFLERGVMCFFKVASPTVKDHFDFYSFPSRIVDLDMDGDRVRYFRVAMPEALVKRQKRSFYRLRPSQRWILSFQAWPESLSKSSVLLLPPPNIELSELNWDQGFLENISAGGLLLEIDPHFLKSSKLPRRNSGEWMIRLAVRNPPDDEILVWWLQARIVNAFLADSGKVELSLKYLSFAQSDEGSPYLDWRVPSNDGVTAIAAWVFHRSVDQVREGKVFS